MCMCPCKIPTLPTHHYLNIAIDCNLVLRSNGCRLQRFKTLQNISLIWVMCACWCCWCGWCIFWGLASILSDAVRFITPHSPHIFCHEVLMVLKSPQHQQNTPSPGQFVGALPPLSFSGNQLTIARYSAKSCSKRNTDDCLVVANHLG